jgi:hypothetical protein
MPLPSTVFEKIVLAAVVIVSLAALAFTVLAPAYSVDSTLVYQGF